MTTTSDARKRLAEAQTPTEHAGCVPGQCRTGEQWRTTSCGEVAGYFVAPDAHDALWVWRENGEYPVPVLAEHNLRDHPTVWAALTAGMEVRP